MSQNLKFDGLKVFSATMHKDRDALGDRVTEWMRQNPHLHVVDTVVQQSSDSQFHCVTIVAFFVDARRTA